MSSSNDNWKGALRSFFDQRGRALSSKPGLEELCFVSGRDPRLWSAPALYTDLIQSILQVTEVDTASTVVEVGCAAGFIAYGVAPAVGSYLGLDIAEGALAAAQRLALPNAAFRKTDGRDLPIAASSVDAAFCYDVVTNFPNFRDYEPLIEEMLRVVRPGGCVLVGSVPDRACQAEYEARVAAFSAELDERYGPARAGLDLPEPGLIERAMLRLGLKSPLPVPSIACYYFDRADFEACALRLGVTLTCSDIHPFNPYRGFRFNAVFRRPTR